MLESISFLIWVLPIVLPSTIYITMYLKFVLKPVRQGTGRKSIVATLFTVSIINLILDPIMLLLIVAWADTLPLGLGRLASLGPLMLWVIAQPTVLTASIFTLLSTFSNIPPKKWSHMPSEANRLGKNTGAVAIRVIVTVVLTELCLIALPAWIFLTLADLIR